MAVKMRVGSTLTFLLLEVAVGVGRVAHFAGVTRGRLARQVANVAYDAVIRLQKEPTGL